MNKLYLILLTLSLNSCSDKFRDDLEKYCNETWGIEVNEECLELYLTEPVEEPQFHIFD